MNTPLRVYIPPDGSPIRDWYRNLIHPVRAFWGDGKPTWPDFYPDFAFYKELLFLAGRIEDADCVFLAMSLNYYIEKNRLDWVKETCDSNYKRGLITYIWIDGDYDFRKNYPGAVFLKNASYESRKLTNEIIRPGDTRVDVLNQVGKLNLLSKSDKPKIGFVGLAAYPKLKLAGLITKNLFLNIKALNNPLFDPPALLPQLLFRNKVLKILERSKQLETDFIRRKIFGAGARNNSSHERNEYLQNINNSHYTLCIRGGGNYSIRFFETLCLGKIPILIDTDCVLPLEDRINYRDFILLVDRKDLKRLPEVILAHYNSLSQEDFKKMQIRARQVWNDYLSPKGFYSNILPGFITNEPKFERL